MRHLLSAACGLALACTVALRADAEEAALSAPIAAGPSQNRVLVELFTSQGCVSCPPADEFFASLVQDKRVIALSLHVDYWDYIGWEDSFAAPEFTDRQKSYARAIGSRTIYTPQFIIGGVERIEGFDPEQTLAALGAREAEASRIAVTLSRKGDDLVIRASADPPLTAPVRLELVRYLPEATVSIERGENAGKTVTYRNIVTSWQSLGDWSGADALDLTVPAPGDAPAVVIVQDFGSTGSAAKGSGPGAILAAVSTD